MFTKKSSRANGCVSQSRSLCFCRGQCSLMGMCLSNGTPGLRSILVGTQLMETASDEWLADFDGDGLA
ncbi:MAG TPA: hypothetical protein VNO24_17450 [Blastocatellia bacterium]|nr:hypothetical protein [Blastocatellia bacterium]